MFIEQIIVDVSNALRLVDAELFMYGYVQANVQKWIGLTRFGEEVLVQCGGFIGKELMVFGMHGDDVGDHLFQGFQ